MAGNSILDLAQAASILSEQKRKASSAYQMKQGLDSLSAYLSAMKQNERNDEKYAMERDSALLTMAKQVQAYNQANAAYDIAAAQGRVAPRQQLNMGDYENSSSIFKNSRSSVLDLINAAVNSQFKPSQEPTSQSITSEGVSNIYGNPLDDEVKRAQIANYRAASKSSGQGGDQRFDDLKELQEAVEESKKHLEKLELLGGTDLQSVRAKNKAKDELFAAEQRLKNEYKRRGHNPVTPIEDKNQINFVIGGGQNQNKPKTDSLKLFSK